MKSPILTENQHNTRESWLRSATAELRAVRRADVAQQGFGRLVVAVRRLPQP